MSNDDRKIIFHITAQTPAAAARTYRLARIKRGALVVAFAAALAVRLPRLRPDGRSRDLHTVR